MNRRKFLLGCAATVVATTVPFVKSLAAPILTAEEAYLAWYTRWLADVMTVFHKHQNQMIIFGASGLRTTDVYPYVEVVWNSEFFADHPEGTRMTISPGFPGRWGNFAERVIVDDVHKASGAFRHVAPTTEGLARFYPINGGVRL